MRDKIISLEEKIESIEKELEIRTESEQTLSRQLAIKDKEMMRLNKRLEEATERNAQLSNLNESKMSRGRDRSASLVEEVFKCQRCGMVSGVNAPCNACGGNVKRVGW